MSGGSMDYLHEKVREASFSEHTPQRMALRRHLNELARVLRCVEWNDSGDGCDGEDEKIEKLLGHAAIIDTALAQANDARERLQAVLERAASTRSGGQS